MTECLQIFLTTRLENAQVEASAEHALFKWLVSGDNLETAIVEGAVGKFHTFWWGFTEHQIGPLDLPPFEWSCCTMVCFPHGHQGALSQTQPGHAVHPTSTPLFWVSAVHPALYDWMALPTNRIGLKKNKIKKHHPWWLGISLFESHTLKT